MVYHKNKKKLLCHYCGYSTNLGRKCKKDNICDFVFSGPGVEKISEGISKDVAQKYAQALGLNLTSGNDLVNLPEYLLGNDSSGTSVYEDPQETVTEEIWKRILAVSYTHLTLPTIYSV